MLSLETIRFWGIGNSYLTFDLVIETERTISKASSEETTLVNEVRLL